jgi:hypothetical protein
LKQGLKTEAKEASRERKGKPENLKKNFIFTILDSISKLKISE